MSIPVRLKVGVGVCLGLLLAGPGLLHAQFSNDWINFSQSYYKIPVTANGIHTITYADLQAAGVPIGTVDPRRINLYHRGAEQAIFIQGQADAVFDPGDFIEFYGKRNDGTLDADLYKPLGSQPNTYYNLYSDTAAYFLTWNPLPVLGKRMPSFFELNGTGLPKETSHLDQRLNLYTTEFANVGDLQQTTFDEGEGWTGTLICTVSSGCTGQSDFLVENLLRGVPSTGTPLLEIQITGRGNVPHQVEIYAGANGGSTRLLTTTSFYGFAAPVLTVPLAWTDIGGDGKMTVRVRLTPTGIRDLVSVSFIKVTYPQDYNLLSSTEKKLDLLPNAGNKSYIELQNPAAGSRIWDISDAGNVGIIGSTVVPGGLGAVIPSTASGKKLFIANSTRPVSLRKVSFRSIAPSLHNYIIISHSLLMKPAGGYNNAVQAYAAYRASSAGGGYDTLTVDMAQLYNQFNYGETSARAIYEFMKYLVNGGDPQFLFLIGKGLEVSQGFFRKTSLLPTDFRDLVPSAGVPGADMAFTAGLSGTSYEPAVATGRLTASTPAQVAAYLNKVKESEALPYDQLWRKDILHLSGGINVGEPAIFRGYVDGFKAIAESYFLGGAAKTISKQTLNVELINVKDQVNKGLNLITFYGHSGPGTIDIDIGYVSDPTLGYQNSGKYPGFLINGCNAGRFFDNRVTFGEDWMLTTNKGAKSFIAHSSFGFANALRQYSDLFYSVAFGDSSFMRKGVGEVQKETARRYLTSYGVSVASITQVQQMVLLGDPAVQLFAAAKPDYEINAGSASIVSLDGNAVTAQSDSFAIEMRVRNFGRALPEPMKVRVVRTLNDNSTVTYDSVYAPVRYSETLRLVIRKTGNPAESGNTLFAITLDADQEIDELREDNNAVSVGFFIPANGTKNLFPPPYSMVSSSTLDLAFQHTNLTSGVRSFQVELDTAATFDSPYLNRKTLSGAGLVKMAVTLLVQDSMVYYWRTKLVNPLPGENTKWTKSSFTYIQQGVEGWAQIKIPQLMENDTTGLTWHPATRRLEFLSTISTVDVTTFGSANPQTPSGASLKINDEEFNVASQGVPCRNNTVNLIAFDKYSTAPYVGIPFSFFDARSCGRAPQLINSFTAAELESATSGLAPWVTNISPSDSVVLFSIGDAGYAGWSTGAKQQLEQLGVSSAQLSSLMAGEPFIIFGKKGASPGNAVVFRPTGTPANAQQLIANKTVTGRLAEGSLRSSVIGPAVSWSSFTTQITGTSASDKVGVNVTGITLSGQETVLKQALVGTHTLTDIDAGVYPFLRLTLHTKDSIDLSPGQLRKWIVTYVPTAEGMLTYAGSLEEEHVEEGQPWKSSFGFTNISNRQFPDSITVHADVFTVEKFSLERKTFKIKAPLPGVTTSFDIQVATKGKGGPNDVTVFANPRVLPELYYDNNILPLYRHLVVAADDKGPLLDVTIDGRHPVDGDVVSASPRILTRVIDRNFFLLKTDTLGVDLFVLFPCPDEGFCPYTRIPFSSAEVVWSPATSVEEFQVSYHPENLQVGTYRLRINASDANGNPSGEKPYEVSFVVKEKPGVHLVSVYPNPSSGVFHFSVRVEGLAAPDDFQLELFSSTGSVVRVLGSNQLTPLHVGTNALSLDAVDAGGSPLPSGIYLFRLSATVGGSRFTKSGRLMVSR
ncbi:MAG: C25 family cysteine peptidase [Cytophagales bacterium]|nr:C25 family cysteine peptidase [Cytophagales bacterium]